MAERDDHIYEFGAFRLQTEDGTLWRGQERVAVTQKAIEMLTLLLENQGRVVTRDEIIERLWPDTFVDENNLSVTVSMLRKAFGENADSSKLIETIPRKGYRINGDVATSYNGLIATHREFTRATIEHTEIDDEAATAAIAHLEKRAGRQNVYLAGFAVCLALLAGGLGWGYFRAKSPFSTPTDRSVAVMPFRDLSADERGRQFSVGLADSLITKLAGIRGLSVRPMSAVMPLADEQLSASSAGQKLNVDAVLEGTIQREGENYRVSVQLVNTKDNQVLWANVLEEKAANLFGFQKLLSSQVADAMAFKLSSQERQRLTQQSTENAEAYREYLLGRFFLSKRTVEDFNAAIPHFEKAISLDPGYAEPHSAMGATYMLLSDSGYAGLAPADGYPKAKIEALKTIELDETIAEAYAVLGNVQLAYDWNVPEGEKSLRRAIELNPSYATAYQWLAWNLILQKRFSEATDLLVRAAQLDPTSLSIASDQGYPDFFAGDYEVAAAKFNSALTLDRNYLAARFNLWRAFHYGGKYAEASAELDAVEALIPKDASILMMARGCTLARQGNSNAAKVIYNKLRTRQRAGEFITPNFTATLVAELNETDDVFTDFEAFLRDHNDYTPYLRLAPEFSKYQTDPRFSEFMKRAGLGG